MNRRPCRCPCGDADEARRDLAREFVDADRAGHELERLDRDVLGGEPLNDPGQHHRARAVADEVDLEVGVGGAIRLEVLDEQPSRPAPSRRSASTIGADAGRALAFISFHSALDGPARDLEQRVELLVDPGELAAERQVLELVLEEAEDRRRRVALPHDVDRVDVVWRHQLIIRSAIEIPPSSPTSPPWAYSTSRRLWRPARASPRPRCRSPSARRGRRSGPGRSLPCLWSIRPPAVTLTT